MNLAQPIKDKASSLGFDAVGITDAAPVDAADTERFEAWLAAGFARRMEYMHRNVGKRFDPAQLLPGAQSVVVVALNYKQAQPDEKPAGPYGRVAQYACYDDYHEFMRPLLHQLAAFIREQAGLATRFKVCVDSVPLAERALAVRAGLGFVGRNHMLIHPTLGPQVFLGEIVTTAEIEPIDDVAAETPCVGCDRCVRACPAGALRDDGRFDAGRCISYLTIEHKGEIAPDLAARVGDRLFGCDECVMACPHRQEAPLCANTRLRFHPERQYLNLADLLEMTPERFEAEFAGSPIHRLGLEGLKRNARTCIENLSKV